MESKFKKIYESKAFSVVLLLIEFSAFLGVCSFIKYSDGDDAFFLQKIAEHPTFLDFTSYLTKTMNGRISATMSLWFVFKNSIWVWRILNAAIMTLYTFMSAKIVKCISNDTVEINTRIIFIASFGIMGIGVLGYSCLWITGSVNYLWPCTAGLVAIYSFVKSVFDGCEKQHLSLKILSVFAGVYTCLAQEQIGAVLVTFCMIIFVCRTFNNKKPDYYQLICLIIMIFSFVLLITSPANENRGIKEVIRWLPEYSSFTFGQKVFITYQWIIHSVSHGIKYVFVFLWSILAYRNFERKKLFKAILCLVFIILAVLSVFGFNFISDVGLDKIDFTKIVTHAPRFKDLSIIQIIAIGWWTIVLVATFILVATLNDKKKHCIAKCLIYLSAIASLAIMFFSPTIYASGDRTLFVSCMLLILLGSSLFVKEIKMKTVIVLIISLGVSASLQLFENYSIIIDILK